MDLTRAAIQKYFSNPDKQIFSSNGYCLLKRQDLNGTLVAGAGVA